jgi:hypothetical protein
MYLGRHTITLSVVDLVFSRIFRNGKPVGDVSDMKV